MTVRDVSTVHALKALAALELIFGLLGACFKGKQHWIVISVRPE
jgi:hypothetical protein